jgi:2-polyprenyl-3-methyl-5-hydroxy-6-metoxy-1,4-benzoquinol methylase
LNIKELYNEAYLREGREFGPGLIHQELQASRGLFHFATESKDRFLSSKDWQNIKVLEVGSGRGCAALNLAKLGAQITLLDYSAEALRQARMIYDHEHVSATFIEGDVSLPEINLKEKFDIILDSHLLHCLALSPERWSYFKFIQDHLAPEGIFVCETMAHRKKLYFPDGFMFDQDNVLWQMFDRWLPIRKIADSLDLETELNQSGFEIVYFYYYAQFGLVPHKKFLDLPSEILPAAVRMNLKIKQK